MTFEGAAQATTVEGPGADDRARRRAPVKWPSSSSAPTAAATSGPNSAHPYENPTPLSNFVETWSIAIIPMAMVWMLGYMVRRRRLAVVIFATMLALYLPMVVFGRRAGRRAATRRSPRIGRGPVHRVDGGQGGPVRRRVSRRSGRVTTTVTSNGSVNAMHDSLTPLGGLMPMIGMWLNNIFGGVGVGFINMLIFVIVAVFVAGMMIGRTPEFLGKKVEAKEMKLASLALLWHPLAILVGTAIACYVWATHGRPGDGARLAEEPRPARLLGDALRVHVGGGQQRLGLRGARRQHAVLEHLDGLVMLLSRYIPIIAPLALAGSLAAKPAAPETAGSLRADSATFGFTLWAVIVILGLLMFMPVAVLGPIAEHLALALVGSGSASC